MRAERGSLFVEGPQMPLGQADMNDRAVAVVAALQNLAVSGKIGEHSAVGDAGFDVDVGERSAQRFAGGNVQAINYFVAQKYIEAFKALAEAPNQKFVMMPMESAGVIGSLAGIAELAKDALGAQAHRPPPMPVARGD